MAIAFVQKASGTNAAGATSTTATSAFVSPTTSGNTILVGVCNDGSPGSITGVTDTQGNKYILVLRWLPTNRPNGAGSEIWVAYNITGSSSNVVTATQGFNDGAIFAYEFSGLSTLGSLDKTISNDGQSTSLTTNATGVTQYPNELLFVVGEQDISGTTTLSAGTGFATNFTTANSNNIAGAAEYQIVSAAGAQTGTMSSTQGIGSYRICMATFADTQIKPSFKPNNLRAYAFSPGLAR